MKKAAVLLLLLTLVLSLTACGDKTEPPASNPPTSESTEVTTPEPAPSESEKIPESSEPTEKPSTATDEKWPDNEFTQQIPKPEWATSGEIITMMGMFDAIFVDASLEDVKAYADELREAGFTQNEKVSDLDFRYQFQAKNDAGYLITLARNGESGKVTLHIDAPTK